MRDVTVTVVEGCCAAAGAAGGAGAPALVLGIVGAIVAVAVAVAAAAALVQALVAAVALITLAIAAVVALGVIGLAVYGLVFGAVAITERVVSAMRPPDTYEVTVTHQADGTMLVERADGSGGRLALPSGRRTANQLALPAGGTTVQVTAERAPTVPDRWRR